MATLGDLPRYAAANGCARTLLASLLGRAGLDALATYPSVEAVHDALLRTAYGSTLSAEANDRQLVGRVISVGVSLLRVLDGPPRAVLRQYLLHHEVDNLKVLIRSIRERRPWEEIAPHIVALPGIGTLDLQSLAAARDLRDFSERLADTPYAHAVHGALHRLEAAGPFAIEVAVELDYYDRLWAATQQLDTADRQAAQQLLGVLFDVLNLTWIAHYRDVLELSAEETLNYTLSHGRWVTVDIRRALTDTARVSWEAALAHTPYATLLAAIPLHGFDAAATSLWRWLASSAQHALFGYPFHIAVPLALLVTQDIEIRDLQILLAAKRIGVGGALDDHFATVRH